MDLGHHLLSFCPIVPYEMSAQAENPLEAFPGRRQVPDDDSEVVDPQDCHDPCLVKGLLSPPIRLGRWASVGQVARSVGHLDARAPSQ